MSIKTIEEAIKEKMNEIDTQESSKEADSYFILERFLKGYAGKCWKKGTETYEH